MKKKAIWNGQVIAVSDATVNVENNYYFPASAINTEFFSDSAMKSHCHWKGEASYYNINVNGKTNNDAAWYYPSTTNQAKHIEGYVAFWKGVEVVDA